jgi:very-short-patch-repair endonuclease
MKIILKENQFRRLVERFEKKTKEQFIDNAHRVHQDENGNPKYDYSLVDYKNVTTPVKIICPKHKQEWKNLTGNEYFEMTPDKHINPGQGCRFCYKEKMTKYPDEDIEKEAKKYKSTTEFKNMAFPYFNAAVKKNREFYDRITSHFVTDKESFGEKLVTKILVDNGLIDPKCLESKSCANREKTFEDCKNTIEGQYCRALRFDFYIPQMNTIIEYDGEQHFRPSSKFGIDKFKQAQQNDKIKNDYCLKNGIKLIRIHFRYPANKIEESLMDALENSEPITFLGNYSKD